MKQIIEFHKKNHNPDPGHALGKCSLKSPFSDIYKHALRECFFVVADIATKSLRRRLAVMHILYSISTLQSPGI